MELVAATLVYPVVLAVLAIGAGLLVDRLLGGALPGVLVPAVGLAALVVVVTLLTYWGTTAPLTPVAVVAVAAAGALLGLRRLRGVRPNWWVVAASAVVYLVVCAPVLLSGRVTEAGYLLDTTAAFQIMGGEHLLEHGRDFAMLPDSSLRQTMERYFGTQYPAGGQVLMAAGGRLVGVESLWLYHPFLATVLALCVGPLYHLGRAASMPRPGAAAAAALAAMPALVYAYAQAGSIKELVALPFVFLLGSVLVLRPPLTALGARGAALVALVGAAGIAAIGLAFGAWLLATLAAGAALAVARSRGRAIDFRRVAAWAAVFAVALVLLALPTFGPLSESLGLARSLSTSNAAAVADPGNLLRPLLPAQVAGVWLGGSHRVDPPHAGLTFSLIGLVAIAALFGLAFLVRRRTWNVLAFVAAIAVVWLALTMRGTAWTDAKLLMMTSPLVVLVAAIGVESLRRGRRRVEAAALGAMLAFGVLASNAFTYHDTNLMPTDRYRELLAIGERFAGDGPTLLPEFDEFALYALDDMAPSGPGFSAKPAELATLADGSMTGYGQSYDLDLLAGGVVMSYPLIVARRRPDASRPPAGFGLAFHGRYYDVWRQEEPETALIAHQPAGVGLQPAGVVGCSKVERLARHATREGATLHYAPRPRVVVGNPQAARSIPPGWALLEQGVALAAPGRLDMRVRVPDAGRFLVWLKGDFARALEVRIDGRRVGEVAYETGNAGNHAPPFTVELTEGTHVLTVERRAGSWRPGDGGPSRLVAVVLEPAGAQPVPVVEAQPDRWRSLCGRTVDWIEVARSP